MQHSVASRMNLAPPLDPALLEQAFTLFRLSRVLYVAAQLDLANHLASGPKTAAELAALTSTHAPSLGSLMDVLAGWGVFSREGEGRYGLTDVSKRMVPGAEGAANLPVLLGWVGFPGTYEAFGDLLHTIQTGECAFQARYKTDFHGYLASHPEMRALYEQAMEATKDSFRLGAKMVDLSEARLLVDVGGGQGALALEFLAINPQLRAISYDLPDVIADAPPIDHPAADRLELVEGNALESVPQGADVYVTSTVLRCFQDEECLTLLKNIRAAMPNNGRLLAFEMIMPPERDHLGHATADLVARTVYGGRDRTEEEFKALFAQAGLQLRQTKAKGNGITLLEAAPT